MVGGWGLWDSVVAGGGCRARGMGTEELGGRVEVGAVELSAGDPGPSLPFSPTPRRRDPGNRPSESVRLPKPILPSSSRTSCGKRYELTNRSRGRVTPLHCISLLPPSVSMPPGSQTGAASAQPRAAIRPQGLPGAGGRRAEPLLLLLLDELWRWAPGPAPATPCQESQTRVQLPAVPVGRRRSRDTTRRADRPPLPPRLEPSLRTEPARQCAVAANRQPPPRCWQRYSLPGNVTLPSYQLSPRLQHDLQGIYIVFCLFF